MKIKLMSIFVMLFLLFVVGCDNYNKVVIKDAVINVEVVDNEEERANGLMFRERLGENDGMLFVFEDSDFRTFWMKNTLIPLDIIFISENFRIINIEEAEPCKEGRCEIYSSMDKAKYVLEVNKEFTEKKNISEGDLVNIRIK